MIAALLFSGRILSTRLSDRVTRQACMRLICFTGEIKKKSFFFIRNYNSRGENCTTTLKISACIAQRNVLDKCNNYQMMRTSLFTNIEAPVF